MTRFVSTTVLKSDVFSQTHSGHMADDETTRVIRRVVSASPLWSRPLAWLLASREIRALKAVRGIEGTPTLIATDKDGLYRTWTDGTPLHLARPDHIGWYRDAHRILRQMRARGLTHNDLAKPQNWLMTPDGRAAVIDFQLASVHDRQGALARTLAWEDLRHLLKQKKSFAPHLLTPVERRILARKSLIGRAWMASGKKVYNFVTRRLFNWSDGEGTGDRIDREGPAILATMNGLPNVTAHALLPWSLPSKGVGLYLFAETEMAEPDLRKALAAHRIEHVQTVATLPRDGTGTVRRDILHFVALNQISELEALLTAEPDLRSSIAPLIAGRKNLTDRRLTRTEVKADA